MNLQLHLQKDETGTLVGFSVRKEEEIWLLIFELWQGWDREEIEFSFNTIKKVLHSLSANAIIPLLMRSLPLKWN